MTQEEKRYFDKKTKEIIDASRRYVETLIKQDETIKTLQRTKPFR